MPMPIVSGRLHEPFDLALGEVLASAIFGIRQPTRRDCSLYGGWSADARSWFHWQFSLCSSITVLIIGIVGTVLIIAGMWLSKNKRAQSLTQVAGSRMLAAAAARTQSMARAFFAGVDGAGNVGLWVTHGTAASTHEITVVPQAGLIHPTSRSPCCGSGGMFVQSDLFTIVSAPCLRPERAAGRPQLRVLQLACIVSLPQDRLQLLKAQSVRHLLRLRKRLRLWWLRAKPTVAAIKALASRRSQRGSVSLVRKGIWGRNYRRPDMQQKLGADLFESTPPARLGQEW